MSQRRRQSDYPVYSHDLREDGIRASEAEMPPAPRRLKTPLWKKLRAFCIVLALLGVVECGAATLTASHFSIKKVSVTGVRNTPELQVQQIAQKLEGHNWLRINAGSVAREVEKIPTVDHVRVRRTLAWPLQLEAQVVVSERQPFVMIGGGEHWWAVDSKGIPYQRLAKPDAVKLNAVTGPNLHPRLGKAMPAAQWRKITTLMHTIAADQKANPEGFEWNLRRIYFDREGNVSLRLKDTRHQELLVQLGASQWEAKLQRARVALAYLDRNGRQAKVLNLVSYKIPTWIPRSDSDKSTLDESAAVSISG